MISQEIPNDFVQLIVKNDDKFKNSCSQSRKIYLKKNTISDTKISFNIMQCQKII